jgi:amino acid transporter
MKGNALTESIPFRHQLKQVVLGKSRDPEDHTVFHKLSLIAFFAWIGLGADGISSSCYGPPEAFTVLGAHYHLGVFVALASALTVFIISSSYSQIIELFPTGGGGYLVATKLLSPTFGMISGCALLIDYMLTIAVSITSGAEAVFSFLPPSWFPYRMVLSIFGIVVLVLLNLRGVKESVVPLVPIFITFIITHLIVIGYTFVTHLMRFPQVAADISADVHRTSGEIGLFGMLFLIMRSYSMGAGTFTGIEAVSNGLPVLRDPKVQTAKRTMKYMAGSLAVMVFGLMLSYLLFRVEGQPGKTLNAVLLGRVTEGWGANWGVIFVLVTLVSEAVLLFVAAQTGFLDGPRVLANMALDRWVPTRFSTLSDRLVTQNGILIMGVAATALVLLSRGSVRFLVVLYSINVFITFFLSQLGMVRHWWSSRKTVSHWIKKLTVNGIGLVLTGFILVSVVVLKFDEGGWITLLVTGALIGVVVLVRRHYENVVNLLKRLDSLVRASEISAKEAIKTGRTVAAEPFDPNAKTAVMFINGFNGLGLHTLFFILRKFEGMFKNFVFVQIGVVDAGNFKGAEDIQNLNQSMKGEADKYVKHMEQYGYHAESACAIGVDVADEIVQLAPQLLERFPQAIFFGGQLVFPQDTFFQRLFHNHTIFTIQRRLNFLGIPVIIMPIRVY